MSEASKKVVDIIKKQFEIHGWPLDLTADNIRDLIRPFVPFVDEEEIVRGLKKIKSAKKPKRQKSELISKMDEKSPKINGLSKNMKNILKKHIVKGLQCEEFIVDIAELL